MLKFITEKKNRSYVRRLPSESDKSFCFRPRVQGGSEFVSIWAAITAKGVDSLVFYDSRMNGRNYIDFTKHELVPYIKRKPSNGSEPWYYVQDNASCQKSEFCMKKNKINILD